MIDNTNQSHSNDEIRSQLEVSPRFRSQIGIFVNATSVDQFRSRFTQRVRDGVDPEVLFKVVVDAAGPLFESPTSLGAYDRKSELANINDCFLLAIVGGGGGGGWVFSIFWVQTKGKLTYRLHWIVQLRRKGTFHQRRLPRGNR